MAFHSTRALTAAGGVLLLALVAACAQPVPPAPAQGWLAVERDGALVLIDPGNGRTISKGAIDDDSSFAWSTNGQLIAFVNDGAIWTSRAEGDPRLHETAQPRPGSPLVWGPKGRLVAFLPADDDGVALLDIVSEEVHLAYPGDTSIEGWWRPRGVEADLFVARQEDGTIALVDAEAETERLVFEGDWVAPSPADARMLFGQDGGLLMWTPFTDSRLLLAGPPNVLAASWAPDGSLIAATRESSSGSEVLIVDVSDGVARPVGNGTAPSWRADGRAVAVERDSAISLLDETGEVLWEGAGRRPAWQPLLRTEFGSAVPDASAPEASRNLLTASRSFEVNADGWINTGDSPPDSVTVNTDSERGDSSMQIDFTGVNSVFAAPQTAIKQTLDGVPVTFSAWVLADDACVHLAHAANGLPEGAGDERSAPHPGDGQWHRLELTVAADYDSTAVTTFVDYGIRCDGVATALVDAVQLELGSTATSFQPDTTDALSALPRGRAVTLP